MKLLSGIGIVMVFLDMFWKEIFNCLLECKVVSRFGVIGVEV